MLHDAARHLVGRQAGVLPDHGDHRDADFGEDVGRRPQRGKQADDEDQQRKNNERVRPLQGDTNQSQHVAYFPTLQVPPASPETGGNSWDQAAIRLSSRICPGFLHGSG